ncbi:MAG: dihydropteroate synthase [Coriobacteriia bacterium]|nr:dihydropteroate synthase [Coriobacteriia bacterium]
MGVLNLTPDSFSDGGMYNCPEQAAEFVHEMYAAAADIIDVGGQSSRPGAEPLTAKAELARVLPTIKRLRAELPDLHLSIDTYHAPVAAAAVAAGVRTINDISGFRDSDMIAVARNSGADCVLMHMAGEPRTMQDDPFYIDVVQEVGDYLLEGARRLEAAGIAAEKIILDPGFGFGKTKEHNLELFLHTDTLAQRIHHAGYRLLVGVSRKSFIGSVFGIKDPLQRDEASAQMAAALASSGSDILRVHNIAATTGALSALTNQQSTTAYVALGSNLGAAMSNVATALQGMDRLPLTRIEAIADPVLSEPAYVRDQQPFINTVCRLQTRLQPLALFAYLQAIEVDMGREKLRPNGPRIIDLDLLTYGECRLDLPLLVLPHPRMAERAFVVEPLRQITDDFSKTSSTTSRGSLSIAEAREGAVIARLPFAALESELAKKQERS